MNKVVLLGRLTKDPEVRYSTGEKETAVARYTVAVDRRFKRDGEPTADFIPWKNRNLQKVNLKVKTLLIQWKSHQLMMDL